MSDNNVLVLDKLPSRPVQRGRSAEIFDFEDGKVIKLYFEGFPVGDVELEYSNTMEAFKCGCTPMECFGKVRCGNRYGIILKKIDGIPLTKMPEKNPLILFKAGKIIAADHAMVHACHSDNLPDLREKAAACLSAEQFGFLSEGEKKKLNDYIMGLPAGNSFIHLDFHTENILMSGDKTVVIDWMTASKGVPEAEIAMMDFLHHHAELFPGSSKVQLAFYTAVRTFIYNSYIKNYTKLTGIKEEASAPWYVVALVLRWGLWNIESEKEYLQAEIKKFTDSI